LIEKIRVVEVRVWRVAASGGNQTWWMLVRHLMRTSADDAPLVKYGKAKATGRPTRRVTVPSEVAEPGETRTSEGFQSGQVPRKTPDGERSRMVMHQTDREMGSESLGRRTGILKEMVAALEGSPGRIDGDPTLLTGKETLEEDEETGSTAHTLRMENGIDGRTLGRTSVILTKVVIALGKVASDGGRPAGVMMENGNDLQKEVETNGFRMKKQMMNDAETRHRVAAREAIRLQRTGT
jgi:hypothetical protein